MSQLVFNSCVGHAAGLTFLSTSEVNGLKMSATKVINNLVTGEALYDSLHNKAPCKLITCSGEVCSGSSMTMYQYAEKSVAKEQQLYRAKQFIQQFYTENDRKGELDARWAKVEADLNADGYYEITSEELEYAGQLAWRNSPRCPGRIQWKNLKLFDCRKITTLEEMFRAVCTHIDYSTNDGNIRPAISVFPPRLPGRPDKFRLWNKQLISYAGYEQEDGSVIGDPAYTFFTKFCQRLGWKGKGGRFDVLPIVVSAQDGVPKFFELPEKIIKVVKIEHPQYPEFAKLGLEWFALPAVSGFLFDAGGVQFPAAPFSGWYSLPEVATRDFLDKQRYDMSEAIAKVLNLDTGDKLNLWQDRVNVETNVAVLYSYGKAQVAMVDHHTQSEQFLDHFKREHELRGGCPSDWVWVVPPESGSLTGVFHQEMLNYQLYPAYLQQEEMARSYRFPEDRSNVTFKAAALALLFSGLLLQKQMKKRPKAVIYYGTETGNSKRNAESISDFLSSSHSVRVKNVKDCNVPELKNAAKDGVLVIFVVSTFGNGDAPTDAKKLKLELNDILNGGGGGVLKSLKYMVLALGSKSYPNFCAFGKFLDTTLEKLGAVKETKVCLVDEMSQPQETFKAWLQDLAFTLGIGQATSNHQSRVKLLENVENKKVERKKQLFRKMSRNQNEFFRSSKQNLAVIGQKSQNTAAKAMLVAREDLGSRNLLLTVDVTELDGEKFQIGDHVGIYPRNELSSVVKLVDKLNNSQVLDEQLRRMSQMLPGAASSIHAMLQTFYDISTVPSRAMLVRLSKRVHSSNDALKMTILTTGPVSQYDAWKKNVGGLIEALDEFPSLAIDVNDLIVMLDTIKPRWYSLASLPRKDAKGRVVVDLVVSPVVYMNKDGALRKGLCSNYLSAVDFSSPLSCLHRSVPTLRHIMENSDKPLIMIGSGSGIAPFRPIWQTKKRDKSSFGDLYLFFGCRNIADNHFEDETEGVVERYVAYSRRRGAPKLYVQDVLKDKGELVWDIVNKRGGSIFVCGAVGMADGVKKVFMGICAKHLSSFDANSAPAYLERMQAESRYVEEIYGSGASG